MGAGFHLLLHDGPTRVEFSPHLTTDRYRELLVITNSLTTKTTSDDLRRELESAARRWGVSVEVERETD